MESTKFRSQGFTDKSRSSPLSFNSSVYLGLIADIFCQVSFSFFPNFVRRMFVIHVRTCTCHEMLRKSTPPDDLKTRIIFFLQCYLGNPGYLMIRIRHRSTNARIKTALFQNGLFLEEIR